MLFLIKSFLAPYLIPIIGVAALLIAGDAVKKFFGRYFYLAIAGGIVLFGVASFLSGDRYRARLCEIEKQQSKSAAQGMDLNIAKESEADDEQREKVLEKAFETKTEKVETYAKKLKDDLACRATQSDVDGVLGIR